MNLKHPAFAPYQSLIAQLGLAHALPDLDTLNTVSASLGITQARGLPLRFFAPDGRLSARDYETHILHTGQVPTRVDTWHDMLNALVWLRFPRFKAALNAAHGDAIATETDTLRGRHRDALTVLDESGVWVISRKPELQAMLTNRAWHSLFWDQRAAVESEMAFIVVGHALLEKALMPYPSITGKCLMLTTDTLDPDCAEAQAVSELDAVRNPRLLAPLPIQGVPGWDPDNAQAAYYANPDIFRPLRGPVHEEGV